MYHILLVSSRKTTIDSLRALIDEQLYRCSSASNQRSALRVARQEAPDLIILDNTAARLSGEKVARALRRILDAPLVAIVRDEESIYELEPTEYLVKPYTSRQLLDCIAEALRYPRTLHAGPLCLDLRTRCISAPHLDGPQALTPKLFFLLRVLMESKGRIVTRKFLMSEVWHTSFIEDTRTLDVHIRWIRERIEPNPSRPIYLRTIRGKGYLLEG